MRTGSVARGVGRSLGPGAFAAVLGLAACGRVVPASVADVDQAPDGGPVGVCDPSLQPPNGPPDPQCVIDPGMRPCLPTASLAEARITLLRDTQFDERGA